MGKLHNRQPASFTIISCCPQAYPLRSMISNAKEWALSRNLVRKNEVHKEEEFRVPTSDEFSFTTTRTREAEGSGSMEVQDPNGTLFNFGDLTAEGALMCLGYIPFRYHMLQVANAFRISVS